MCCPPPPQKKDNQPKLPPQKTRFYANLPPADRAGATENFGQSHFLSANIAHYSRGPVSFAKITVSSLKIKNYANLRPAFSPLRKILPHRTHNLFPNPYLFRTFLASQPRSSHPGWKPYMNLNQTKSRSLPPFRFTGTTLSKLAPTEPINIFEKNTLHDSPGKFCLKPYFYRGKRKVDHQLTSLWTTSWPAKRKKVDNQLTLQHIYIYAYNLIQWATFRLQKVKKQRERWKTKARKGRWERRQNIETWKTPTPSVGVCWVIFYYKTG